jgi:uncharacterized protein (TIGR02594 family)
MKAFFEWLKSLFTKPVKIEPLPKVNETLWMDIANKEIGVTEVKGLKHNPRVVEYHDATGLSANDDETSWCAAFASWVLLKAGYKSPKTAWARDFQNYGTKLDKPKYGCLMGFERNGPGGDSHIAFYVKDDAKYYYVLGGNQDNQVCIKGYPKSALLYMRWPVKDGVLPKPVQSNGRIALSWEHTDAPHPERKAWSDRLIEGISIHLPLYRGASDIAKLHPNFAQLSIIEQMKVIGEFWVALAWFECGYNPKSHSVDVGTQGDKGSWSVGLYQMSANDNSAQKFGYSFEDLQDPLKNIDVALEQMRKQLALRDKLFLDNSDSMRYWATLLIGNKYSKIAQIRERVIARVGV